MNKRFRGFAASLFVCNLFVQVNNAQSISSNALHQRVFTSAAPLIYHTESWAFDAGAPVRSSPLVAGNMVFFGTTKGDFFSLDKTKGKVLWKFTAANAINSSACANNGKVFFADNSQTVYAVHAKTGKLIWKFSMTKKMEYPWRFDYFYSSPMVQGHQLFIGGDDGYLYALNVETGQTFWKYRARTLIRSSPVVHQQNVLFGDMDGRLVALDKKTGKEKWIFNTVGDTLKNEDWGFDRKGILSSPVIADDKILFGCRDGFLYCLDKEGKEIWRMDHKISWVISTMAVNDSFVVTGTSDGRFVQAVHLLSGKQLWKFTPNALFWSSAAIVNNEVYIGSFDGVLYALDLKTGRRIAQFNTADKIMSSAAYSDGLLYFGSDDGKLYALGGRKNEQPPNLNRFVYYEAGVNNYFRANADLRIKNYLVNSGFTLVGTDTLPAILGSNAANAVVVFASNYFPKPIINQKGNSLLRKFLDSGGRVVVLGNNPLLFQFDEKTKQAVAFNVTAADTVLGLQYGPNDTRGVGGQFTSFATNTGKALGLPAFWSSMGYLPAEQVNVVLGKNENGLASAFIKNYKNGGRLIQVFLHPDLPVHLDAVIKAAEWKIEN